MTVRIVVDSTSDIGLERAAQHGITVVPVTVRFGDQEFRDGVDISAARFHSMLANSTVLPNTAAPSIGTFEETYRRIIADGASSILCVTLRVPKLSELGRCSQARDPNGTHTHC